MGTELAVKKEERIQKQDPIFEKYKGAFKLEEETIGENTQALDETRNHLYKSLLEMGQIKTNIDMMLLTYGHEGKDPRQFIACKFHFVMRQARFALSESKKHDIDLQECERVILRAKKSFVYRLWLRIRGKYPDLELRRLEMQRDEIKLNLFNRITRLQIYRMLHDKLIELNEGKRITNKQYQDEQPYYYNWFIKDKIFTSYIAKYLGVGVGVVDAHQKLSQDSILPEVSESMKRVFSVTPLLLEDSRGKKRKEYLPSFDLKKIVEDSCNKGQFLPDWTEGISSSEEKEDLKEIFS